MALDFFASCPKGLESLLLDELRSLKPEQAKETVGGVYFTASMEVAYRCCLWSRLANGVFYSLAKGPVDNADELYRLVSGIEWEEHFNPDNSFVVDFIGTNKSIKNSHFGALKVKDAIVDRFQKLFQRRPSIAKRDPHIRINAHLHKGQLSVSLNISGESLHRRGYRQAGGLAPLKENLAAAILIRSGWPEIAKKGGALLDPMCGSGTFLIEAATLAADIAPNLERKQWGFDHWLGHVPKLWKDLLAEAKQRKQDGLGYGLPEIRGYDDSLKALDAADENIARAGLEKWVRVSRKEVREFAVPTHREIVPGLVVCNPPYGERLGDVKALEHLYCHLGERLRAGFEGWQMGMITGNPDLGKTMGIRSHRQYQLRNGNIPSKLLLFDIEESRYVNKPHADVAQATADAPLSEGATMFANRLRKNWKALSKWAKKEDIQCFRVYDADIPEYAVAVDWYCGQVHVSEYAPPASVDPVQAERRIDDVMAAIPTVLDTAGDKVALKRRQRQRGSEQYRQQSQQGDFVEVREGEARLLVNLFDYLDTGLFLDHRPVRLDIARRAKDLRFLNLFCYTATASVHAAIGGARYTVSVDMSPTYLRWARKNLALNGLSESRHRTVEANCMEWLADPDNQQPFDLILLDPPTFSNSKKMSDTLDIQRDHVSLIRSVLPLLAEDGLLIFSNNFRRFRFDHEALPEVQAEDVSASTIDRDFARNPKIHQCWHIRHRKTDADS